MGAQHVSAVQVVVIALLSAGVVSWNEQTVKVLLHRDHRAEVVMHREERVA